MHGNKIRVADFALSAVTLSQPIKLCAIFGCELQAPAEQTMTRTMVDDFSFCHYSSNVHQTTPDTLSSDARSTDEFLDFSGGSPSQKAVFCVVSKKDDHDITLSRSPFLVHYRATECLETTVGLITPNRVNVIEMIGGEGQRLMKMRSISSSWPWPCDETASSACKASSEHASGR